MSAPDRVGRAAGAVAGAVLHLWGVAALVGAWQLWVSVHGYNAIVMPTPAEVASDLVHHLSAYAPQLAFTVGLSLVGLAAGMVLGAVLAVAIWVSPVLSGLSTPMALVLRAVPVLAMIPVLGRLLGYNDRTEAIVAALVCFFPAFVMTSAGLRRPPAGSRDVAAVLGARRSGLLRHVLLPGALPGFLVALRLTAPLSVLAAMLAEYLMGTRGLGYLLATSAQLFQTSREWGAAVLGTVLSVALFLAAGRLERAAGRRWA
ncbi:MAG: ABC transporter permease subunit [Actinomycetota bacterium]|nr:ABC transporter permease subunit [Actinomycetota bacterium]MDA8282284.1 ABC transporter permease subunit [Actinomycetota bacterium]